MYCPSCQLTFEEPIQRCPECHGALKSVARGKKIPSISGWQSPGSWKPEPAAGPDTEDDWSTPYGSGKAADSKPAATFDSNEWDDWVDEEPEEVQGLSPTGTEYVGHLMGGSAPPPPPIRSGNMMLAAAVLVVLILTGGYLYRSRMDEGPTDSGSQVSTTSDAEIWLQSARQSMTDKDFELAAAQWKKGVELLKQSKADPKLLEESTQSMALALTKTGEFEAAHEALSSLKSPPKDQLKSLERSLRIKANDLLASARQRSEGSSTAQSDARLALKYYEQYGGSKAQRAQALEFIGKSYITQRNSSAAAMALRRSLDLEYTAQRASLLSSLNLPSQPRPAAVEYSRPVERPTFELTAGQKQVPQGGRPAEKYPVAEAQVQAPSNTGSEPEQQQPQVVIDTSSEHTGQRPAPPPLSNPSTNSSGQSDHGSSQQDVVPTYNGGRGSNDRPPGY